MTLPINLFFIIFLEIFFSRIFFIYINQENKERLEKRAPERYQNLSKEEEEKKQQYGHESYKNLSKD